MKFLKFLAALCLIIFAGVLWVMMQIPSDHEIKNCIVTKMYHVHLCPGSKDYVPLHEISPYMQKAVVMSEDTMFWSHHGFDWDEMEKSARQNWEKGEYKRGGSTITQQLAKNMFLTKDKSLIRKGIEALITMRIEEVLKKKEILERYLNVVQFGKDIYGIKAASHHYFRKAPIDLNLNEAAFLTMLLPSPEKYSVSFKQQFLTPFARGRIQHIIAMLEKTGKISAGERDEATNKLDFFFGPEPETGVMSTAVPPGQNGMSEFDPEEGDQ